MKISLRSVHEEHHPCCFLRVSAFSTNKQANVIGEKSQPLCESKNPAIKIRNVAKPGIPIAQIDGSVEFLLFFFLREKEEKKEEKGGGRSEFELRPELFRSMGKRMADDDGDRRKFVGTVVLVGRPHSFTCIVRKTGLHLPILSSTAYIMRTRRV